MTRPRVLAALPVFLFEDVDLKKRTLLISVDGALYDEVRAIAKKKRIPADKLVSRWIQEKLRSAA